MKPRITIDKLEITINGNKLSLTIEQARELRDILNDAFPLGAPFTPPTWLFPPVIIDRTPVPAWPHWLPSVTCSARENSVTLSLDGR